MVWEVCFLNILLTGGAGYIGSHTAVELIENGHNVIVFDNLSNSSVAVLDCICHITGIKPVFFKGDVNDRDSLLDVFARENIDVVIHFAGLKSVDESVDFPLKYYENNVMGAINLVAVMDQVKVKSLIFSSSASVYGIPKNLPITEESATKPVSVYGKSKLYVEEIMSDVAVSERPDGVPNNLAPYITEVILKKREHLFVYGDDYPTNDGTGVRDYIHIKDLVGGHLAAIAHIEHQTYGTEIFNLGSGKGSSVLEVIKGFEQDLGKKVRYKVVKRRVGDVAECFADVSKAKAVLGWEATLSLPEMCQSALNFATQLSSNGAQTPESKGEQ
jgi:UDP-glucose 4-epimerase